MNTPALALTGEESAMLAGTRGAGTAMAMRLVTGLAGVLGATRLIPITGAHIDGCLYHGRAGLDFARKLVDLGATVAVPTTLNVSSLDLMHPGLVRLPPTEAVPARALMDAYTALGAKPTWTCAPYQSVQRPGAGEHIAWAESNAIVFANSVLGARTERYGDFIDICAAITGRVPEAGLHLPANRVPTLELDCSGLSASLLAHDAAWAALGDVVGRRSGTGVPLLTGIDPDLVDEDKLKALGATAASAGGVALFHVAGVTPEALADAPAAPESLPVERVTAAMLRAARDELTTAAGARALDAVALGTPHFSLPEFEKLAQALADAPAFHPDCTVWISTSREVLARARDAGFVQVAEARGARIVVDTCTYITPILAPDTRTVMTPSGKWAWYAPANLGVDVVFGTLGECVASACAGEVIRDDTHWS
ncbi:aconitase X [Specibacter cremeus]|uniref:aconitase X n=1 Tax=Specibacter cremeus TaxID=1629051 RepID=UPI000F76E5F1|nr:aconitase X catalytic domain-containing protein [Specibacter cremeus]